MRGPARPELVERQFAAGWSPPPVEKAPAAIPSRGLRIRGEGSASVRGGGGAPPPVEKKMTTKRTLLLTITVVALASHSVHADVRSDQKTHVEFGGMLGHMVSMFGGKAAREGTTSTVAVKGDRMARINDATGQIVDLAEEKVYDLDIKKKSYRVTTFAELRRRMEEARRKAEEDAARAEGHETSTASAPPENNVEVDLSVKNTGE